MREITFKRCQKCGKVFRNYEKPNECIFCFSSKDVVEVVYQVPGRSAARDNNSSPKWMGSGAYTSGKKKARVG